MSPTRIEIRDWSRPTHAYKPGMPVYVRYGIWGADYGGRGHSHNHHTGERERGLSVYPARLVDGAVVLDADVPDAYFKELRGRFAFPVTGEVVGRGSDGEPVLRAVKCLRLPLSLSVGQMAKEGAE